MKRQCRNLWPLLRHSTGVAQLVDTVVPFVDLNWDKLPEKATIYEVGPRDGLQNNSNFVSTRNKLRYIEYLAEAGVKIIEATSFVSPSAVPQMKDAVELMTALKDIEFGPEMSFPVLAPNMRGLSDILKVNSTGKKIIDTVCVVGAVSDSFLLSNINETVDSSLENFERVCHASLENDLQVRGYLSCILGCPFEGYIEPAKTAEVSLRLWEMGCSSICLSDTVGIGRPGLMQEVIRAVVDVGIPLEAIAVHLHNTYGQALTNLLVALFEGVSIFDSGAGGLGGCPYSPGATGNISTEDVLFLLHGLGVETGLSLDRVIAAGRFIAEAASSSVNSNVSNALKKAVPHYGLI